MPAPFYNAIKGTTAGTPGTGAFTPNAASSGFRAWSTVPTGWTGMVRFDDVSNAWELCWCYWNGTTLSRAATQVYDSSAGGFGVQCPLTSAATATMIVSAGEVMSHIGTTKWAAWTAITSSSGLSNVGLPAPTVTGTAAAGAIATTNYLTLQSRVQNTSATTANAMAAWTTSNVSAAVSTTAGQGGGEMTTRFGASQLPTGPRLFVALTSTNYAGTTGEPSALAANIVGFTKDSGDTNIQFTTKDGTTANKQDTGIALTANGWYETCVWFEPGSNKMYGLICRLDTGAIWLGSSATNSPANGALMFPQVVGGLSSTTGTAIIMHLASMALRSGS